MKDSMDAKGPEDAIEKVLAGLRDVEVPAGMERRILERLDGQVSVVEARSGWRRLVPAWMTTASKPVAAKALIFGVALAGVIAAVLVVPAIRQLGPMPEQSNASDLPGAANRTTPAISAGVAERSSHGSRVWSGITAKTTDAALVPAADDGIAPTEDDVARSEMQAASFPAPPMPLTAQERLLLRLAHKVNPVEMAMLDPKFRAIEDAEEKAEFQKFFGQIPVKVVDSAETSGGKSTTDQAVQPSATDPGVKVQAPPDEAAPATDQGVPATQDKPNQKQAAPESSSPDQSKTQQPTATPTGTGENE